MANHLKFAPFTSFLDAGFWHKLTENKLDLYGLDDSAKAINGFYFNGDPPGMPCRMTIDYTAFDSEPKTPPHCFPFVGTLINTNTIERFRECDKKDLLNDIGKQIWDDITHGRALTEPSLLCRFLLLTFADLKKYHYYYWFAFPCLCLADDIEVLAQPRSITTVYSQTKVASLRREYDAFQKDQKAHTGFFIVRDQGEEMRVETIQTVDKTSLDSNKIILGFCDPCTIDGHPGWPLRNFLALAAYQWGDKLNEVEILSFRDRSKDGVRDIGHSLIFTIKLPPSSSTECPKCVGWEKNERGKLGPRMVNLSTSMDPVRLAASAVDLNLKLMRWRLLPELDLEKISTTKCLLFGSGTLGCNVARCLLGWGVRNITLIDNGKVSYSNPVRQSLFVFEDCMHGGKAKAQAAAEGLKKIFPGVNAVGIQLSIPMPGHFVTDSCVEQVRQEVHRLEALVESHDAIFLLLDTRESRWLPTLLGAVKRKIVMCGALGFDTYLVMRHGMKMNREAGDAPAEPLSQMGSLAIPGDQLGCYFCNDVVAPGDSTKDRTVDQQCTVSRPGMSYIVSALVSELLVSVLQHPQGSFAAADTSSRDEHLTQESDCPLGLVPHQIRGFLSRYHTVLPACRAFDKCTACSRAVLEGYEKDGFDFLLKAFNDPSFLEDFTGLTQMHAETLDAEVWGFSDDDDCTEMEM